MRVRIGFSFQRGGTDHFWFPIHDSLIDRQVDICLDCKRRSCQTFQRNSETRSRQSFCNWMRRVIFLSRLTNKNCDHPGIWRRMRIPPENDYYYEASLRGVVRLIRRVFHSTT
jgi:hypothetical protein